MNPDFPIDEFGKFMNFGKVNEEQILDELVGMLHNCTQVRCLDGEIKSNENGHAINESW